MAGPIHYEIYFRKTAPAPWTLLQACEDRKQAIETAEDMLADKRAVAVRVTKETLDPDTMAFDSVTILTRGAPEPPKPKASRDADLAPPCTGPGDLYTPHARELIGRVLEDWLARQGATAFELLHRPDLAELLEASGVELQHAIQKVAVPESQATGQPVHELVRFYQKLSDQAVERVIQAGRRQQFPSLANRPLADVANKLAGGSDRAFLMGGVVCDALKGLRKPSERLDRLMDLADRAPEAGPARALVMVPIEQILSEMLGSRAVLAAILGADLDLGASLAAAVRLVAPREVEMLTRADRRMAAMMPPTDGPTARLAARLAAGEYPLLAAALVRMVVRELTGPRRLRPSNARGEIDILRALAMGLTATAGRLLSLDEIQHAFTERSKALVTADFVGAYVSICNTAICEAEHLTRLCENVTGGANKRSAARWLAACVTSLKFESEMRAGATPPVAAQRLTVLARLQKGVRAAALGERDEQQILEAIGAVGGVVEAEGRLVAQLGRSPAPAHQKLSALLKLAAGETAPSGPAADRAKAEAMRLFRAPETRAEITAEPTVLPTLKPLLQAAGLAA